MERSPIKTGKISRLARNDNGQTYFTWPEESSKLFKMDKPIRPIRQSHAKQAQGKPIIVVDLDNVLSLSAEGFVAFSNAHFGTQITTKDYSEDWANMWDISFEEAVSRGDYMRAQNIHRTYRPVEGAFEALSKLKDAYRLVILTSRRQSVELITTEWLEKFFPDIFEEVLFSGIWEGGEASNGHLLTKGEQYVQLGARYVIDDHLKHCAAAAEKGISAVLFGEFAWNEHDALPHGVKRCKDWGAVLEYFYGPR